MTQESESQLFSKFELFLVYLARTVSVSFIFVPIGHNTMAKWFVIMCAITCCLSIYGHYLTMACKAKHKFAISMSELSY